MAWTAILVEKRREGTQGVAVVQYLEDGVAWMTETYRTGAPTLQWLQDTVRNRIKQLTDGSAFNPAPGPITPSPDPPAPDATLATLQRDLNRLRRVTELEAMGVTGILTNPQKTQLTNDVKNAISGNLTYLDVIR